MFINLKKTPKKTTTTIIGISIFGYENEEEYPFHVSKNTFKSHVELLLIGEKDKRHYILIKKFSFMIIYDRGRKHICCYY